MTDDVCHPIIPRTSEDGRFVKSRVRYIDTFTFEYIPSRHRLFISGLDEFSLHYDIGTTHDIILALFDFRRKHSPDELDYSFPRNAKYKEEIRKSKFGLSYPVAMITEQGIVDLFELVSESSAYFFLKKHTNFDYHRDFYTQVSDAYVDTYSELHEKRKSMPTEYEDYYELRPKSTWFSRYKREPDTPTKNKTQSNRHSENPNYPQWRNKVLTRDKVCQCCGHDDKLEVHHLFGYKENPSLQTNTGNGVTLCKFCHAKYHSIYGLKNINPIDFIDFIKTYGVVK